jgi:hypothetical protein
MKVDGAIFVENPLDAGPAAANLEAAGYRGGNGTPLDFRGEHYTPTRS